jgi:4-hydroxy-tetrahydrodipicolinate synthase
MSQFASNPDAVRGAITPLVTPFHDDGAVDTETVARLVDWQLERGSHGISVGGSTGEPTAQSLAERVAVMRAAADALADRAPFVPGTGTARLDETLELTAEAERLGAAAALVVAPYYARPQQDGLADWYGRVAAEFPDFPILVYNVPIRSSVDIAPTTVARLRRRYPNIVGIKETTRDFEHVSHVLSQCGADFIVLSGIELLCYPMLALGGRGHLSCVANFAPEPVAELYDAFAAGDHERARALHYELGPLVEAAFIEVNPVPAKWIMFELGIMPSAKTREPLATLAESSSLAIRELLGDRLKQHASAPGVGGIGA